MSKARPDVTRFQKKVFDATKRIPKGKVSTYGHIARAIGCASPISAGLLVGALVLGLYSARQAIA